MMLLNLCVVYELSKHYSATTLSNIYSSKEESPVIYFRQGFDGKASTQPYEIA